MPSRLRFVVIGTVFFLYCPFGGDRLKRVLDELEAIARTRQTRVCCVGMPPLHHRPPGAEIAWQALLSGVTRVLAALDRPARDAEPIATAIWSASHGFCSLELAGFPAGDDAYADLLELCATGILDAPKSARNRSAGRSESRGSTTRAARTPARPNRSVARKI
jgi:hypothetical protein